MKTLTSKLNNKNAQIAALVLIAFFGLISCGPQTISKSSGLLSSTSSTSGALMAECSHDVSGGPTQARLMSHVDANGVKNVRLMRMKFDAFPSGFTSTSKSAALQIFKREVSSAGVVSAPVRVDFQLERRNGNDFKLITGALNQLDWTQMSALAKDGFGIASLTEGMQLFNNASFIINLNDTIGAAKILTVALYEDPGKAPTKQVDILIPAFEADPAQYATNHAASLTKLHPLKSYPTGSDFVAASQSFCF